MKLISRVLLSTALVVFSIFYCAGQGGSILPVNPSACVNTAIQLTLSGPSQTTGFTWTVPATATIVSGQGTKVINIKFTSAGPGQVVSVSGNGMNPSPSMGVTVYSPVGSPGTIIGTPSLCPGTSSAYSISASIANASRTFWQTSTGNATVTSQSSTSASVSFSSAFTSGVITVYGNNDGCPNGPASNLTVSSYPVPGAAGAISISGGSSTVVTAGSTSVPVSIAPPTNAARYQWTPLPTGITFTSSTPQNISNSILVDVASTFVTGTITVIPISGPGCIGPSSSVTLTANSLPDAAGAITGHTAKCASTTAVLDTFSINPINKATGYNWGVTNGSVISGQNTTTAIVQFNPGVLSGQVSVSGTNSSGGGASSSVSVQMYQPMDVAGLITGSLAVCPGTNSTTYRASAINNATGYRWTLPSGATLSSGSNGNSISINVDIASNFRGGAISFIGTSPGCGLSHSSTVVITTPTAPATPSAITGSATVCKGEQGKIYYVPPVTTGCDYLWAPPNGMTIVSGQGTNSIIVNFSSTFTVGTLTVKSVNSCTMSPPATLTISPSSGTPAVVSLISNPNPIAGDAAIGMSVSSSPSSVSYLWRKNGVIIPSATSSSFSIATPQINDEAIYDVVVTSGSCVTISSPFNLVVNKQPTLNYITSRTVLADNQLVAASIPGLPVDASQTTIQYFDGLGRLQQQVEWQQSPQQFDVVQPTVYDNIGREKFKYLPFVSTDKGALFKAVTFDASNNYSSTNFYNNATDNVADDTRPFSQINFEESPLNRVLSTLGPGQSWNTVSKAVVTNSITNDYGTAANQEKIIAWKVDASSGLPIRNLTVMSPSTAGYYPKGLLTITSTKDEQGNEIREYKNLAGLVILKKVCAVASTTDFNTIGNWAETYYIYDDLNLLRFVLQPELSKILAASTTLNPTTTQLNSFAFQYAYDGRHRMIQKTIPGADPIYMVYDKRDRLVMSQSGIQRKDASGNPKMEWLFTKYDALDRPVITGIYTHGTVVDQPTMSGLISSSNFFETFIGDNVPDSHGYTNIVFPTQNIQLLTITYYDRYDFKKLITNNTTFDYTNSELDGSSGYTAQELAPSAKVSGHITGTKTRMLLTGTWLKTVNYYDEKYKLIQQIADNIKGHTVATTVYDFEGKVLRTKTSLYTGQPVTWANVVGATVQGNSLSFTGTGGNWNQGATSSQILPANTDGWIEVTVSEVSVRFMIGLGDVYGGVGYANIDYPFYVAPGTPATVSTYEGGTSGLGHGNVISGDVLRVERINGIIYYKRNGLVVYTSPTRSTSSLFVYVTLNSAGSKVSNVVVSNTFSPSAYSATSSFVKRFAYDQAGRLIDTWHKLAIGGNTGNEILLTHNIYNELGQLVDKKLHSTVATAADAKQSVDYRYNIRGWLTSINNAELSSTGTNDDTGDLFGMNLAYNDDLGTGNLSNLQYNGNISAVKWSNGLGSGPVKQMGYNFVYDPMNRLAAASSLQAAALNTWAAGQYDENGLTYDLNGNIKTLQRKGAGGVTIDNLTYAYTAVAGNQLQSVTDATAATDKTKGFNDGSTSGNDYSYDANGNLTIDRNKTISTPITYNYLNLPEQIYRNTQYDYIQYLYDATGLKREQVLTQRLQQKITDYVGSWVFENNQLQFVQHDEGRIVISNEQKLYGNSFDVVSTDILVTPTATSNVALSALAANGEKYVKVSCAANGGPVKQGVTFGTVYTVMEGERYLFRLKGYFNGNYVSLYALGNGTDLVYPGTEIPKGLVNETWVESTIVIPQGVTQLTLGIVWTVSSTTTDNFLINEMEFYKLSTNTTPEYQYNLKDHLGNVRVTFTTKQEIESATATFETPNIATEQSQFLRYDNARKVTHYLFDHTNGSAPTTTTGTAQRLSGQSNEVYGLAKSLSVMPGDVIDMEVYAKYIDSNSANRTANLNTLISQIATGTAPGGTVVDGGNYFTSTTSFPFPGGLNGSGSSTGTGPKAYLNWLVFDRNYNLIIGKCGYTRMSTSARETGQDVAHEKLPGSVTITEAGYVYIYLSNEEGANPYEVYFDDMKVTQIKSPVIALNDYYPFGLTFNSYTRENSVPNKFKFQSQEHIDDLGLNWDQFKWRNSMPDIGRFFNVDPLAEKYLYNSPYAFSENRVVNAIELEGLEALIVTTRNISAQRTSTPTAAQATSSTMAVALLHPNEVLQIGEIQSGSTNISSVSGRIGRHMAEGGNMSKGEGGEENGFRHALWSATLTNKFGADAALQLTNSHEGIGPFENATVDFTQPLIQKAGLADGIVDLLNNAIGQNIAANLPENASAKDIAAGVLNVQKNEGLWAVSKDENGNVSISRKVITQKQFDQANKQLNTLDNNGFNDADKKTLDEKKKK